jgi:archaellum biogenesis ATPase FlaH
MERQILEAAISGRAHFEELERHEIKGTLSDQGEVLWEAIADYYQKDKDAESVDKALLNIALERKHAKHADIFKTIIDGFKETSAANLLHEIRLHKIEAVRLELASALASAKQGKVDELIDKYQKLVNTAEGESDSSDVLIAPDLGSIMEERSAEHRLKILPEALTRCLEGGPLRGHHIVLFAVTDMGKTLFTINMVRGFIEAGLKVLYVGNEDPVSDLIERFLVSLTGRDKFAVRKNWRKAQEYAEKKGWRNLVWAELSPGTLPEIRRLIEEHRPDVLVVDQIRNLDTGDKNFVRVLEVAAQGMRNFAKKYNLLSVSITQAGDSANGKSILTRGDIDNSNVGIPGTADLMLGIGASVDDEYNGIRVLSFPKNKISGNKQPLQVVFNTTTMRVE